LLEVERQLAFGDGQQRLGEATGGCKGIILSQGGFQRRGVQTSDDIRDAVGEGFCTRAVGQQQYQRRNQGDNDMICMSKACMTGSASAMSITRPTNSTFRARPSSLASRQVWAANSISRLMPPTFSS